jgi:hypothetical protein
MNKLIKELESAGLSDIAVKDILSKYEVFEMGVSSGNSSGMSSRDLMSSMVLKSLSVEGSEELTKSSLKSKKKLLNRSKSLSKSLSLEEETLNNECLDAFNESSAATGSTPIVVKKMSAKDKALEKALAKEESKKAKEEAKALAKEEALKAKYEAKKAR